MVPKFLALPLAIGATLNQSFWEEWSDEWGISQKMLAHEAWRDWNDELASEVFFEKFKKYYNENNSDSWILIRSFILIDESRSKY